ncbi:response regulator [Salinispira pacifica]|uniref:Response regulator n=1 Tax=Salinispira pacifica TaxID=1307761 RepID=V5WFC1_9SPIO|nr:response regulator transcription factor [Salinispira pacifica]AHC14492.1 response regulator [Salinispira pacifica]
MNILFVDDHTIFREGVASFFTEDKKCKSLFTAANIDDALAILRNEPVDLLITDLNFPERSGFELLENLQGEAIEIPVIVLSMLDDMETVKKVLSLGARGYITKSSGFESLSRAIKEVSTGGYHFDQQILSLLVKCAVKQVKKADCNGFDETALLDLSERQREVFLLLAKGIKIEEIAEKLYISLKTVENHRTQIYKKLGVSDRLELHRLAEECQLI